LDSHDLGVRANHGEVGHRKMGDFSIKNVPLHGGFNHQKYGGFSMI